MAAKHARGQEFIERLGRLAEGEGLPRTAGRMMALLMIDESPLGIDDVATRLKVSRASVSTNGRLLESLHIASRITLPGDRRDYLQISADPCSSLLALGVRRLHDMRRAVAEMGEATPRSGANAAIRQRLQKMESFYKMAISSAESVIADWARQNTRMSRK
jgi:DNA-binding transcriptional regulator GbsR (MarR family)